MVGARLIVGEPLVRSANSVVCGVVPFVSLTVMAHSPRSARSGRRFGSFQSWPAESLGECRVDQRKHNSIRGLRSACLACFEPSHSSVRHDLRESEVTRQTASKMPSGATIRAADPGKYFRWTSDPGRPATSANARKTRRKSPFPNRRRELLRCGSAINSRSRETHGITSTWHTPMGFGMCTAQCGIDSRSKFGSEVSIKARTG